MEYLLKLLVEFKVQLVQQVLKAPLLSLPHGG
jgi:hypothetical protein